MTHATQYGARARHSAQAYANIGLETQVFSASPEHLITLLLDGALAAIAKARLHMQSNSIGGRGAAISKAIDIVESGLKASINQDAGGEVAKSLIAAYDMVIRSLLLANLNSDYDKLALAERMLTDIREAWRTAADRSN